MVRAAYSYKRKEKHFCSSEPGCSKVKTSLVKVLLNFQKLISLICQYFFVKKCEKLLLAAIGAVGV